MPSAVGPISGVDQNRTATMALNRAKAILLIALLIAACLCAALGFVWDRGKWLTSAGLLFDLAGLVQLEISGLFERIVDRFGDEEEFPYGPPSHITHKIIDNPDTPVRTALRNFLFFDLKTGFRLIVLGVALQLVAVWV
jgi:hypothetical protein